MIDISNFRQPDFALQLGLSQDAGNPVTIGKGFQPAETQQIQTFFDYFDFDNCFLWLNEPLTAQSFLCDSLSKSALKNVRMSNHHRPDAIIFRPPKSIFLIEFTRELTTRTLGQIIHYDYLYRKLTNRNFNLHNVVVFTMTEQSLIFHLLEREIIPILTVPLDLEPELPPEYCICFKKAGNLDLEYVEPNIFKVYDDHFPKTPNIFEKDE